MLLCLVAWKCNGFLSPKRKHCNTASTSRSEVSSTLYFSRSNDVDDEKSDDTEAWDANVDYEKEWPKDQSPPDPSSAWDALPNMPDAPRLGIDLQLKPLSEEEAQLIKEEASDIINQKIDAGIEDIEKLRTKMAKELDSQRKVMQVASELQAKQKSEELMSKIDKLAGNFLDSTKETRTSTKMAAAASRAMEGTSRGIELGTWGTLGGRTIVAGSIDNDILLGSVANAERDIELKDKTDGKSDEESLIENRIVILADTKQVRERVDTNITIMSYAFIHSFIYLFIYLFVLLRLGSLRQTIGSGIDRKIGSHQHSKFATGRFVSDSYHALGREQCSVHSYHVYIDKPRKLAEIGVRSITAQNTPSGR